MFGFIKKIFIILLTSIVNASNDTKCALLVHCASALHHSTYSY